MPPRKRSRADSSSSQELSDTDIDRPIILARIVGLNVHFERGFQISALQTSIYTYHVNCMKLWTMEVVRIPSNVVYFRGLIHNHISSTLSEDHQTALRGNHSS
ncbi:uncharacterized protein LOC109838043 isoform X5 [Asparagus officinalis]|uniref:uncharacterized protein LOC109838043 isoform X5 n=1 Tax=Asparagus officinalis TaxID=4686 RepID=UPI00098E2F54|nr:uncharacterized protein LOC109838043 isoform X5 [Asparagus officinalis]